MTKLYQKSEITFAIVWIAAYVVLSGLADQLSASLGAVKSVTAVMAVTEAPARGRTEETDKRTDTEENDLEEINCNQKLVERQNPLSNSENKCLRCSKTDCEFRQK